MKKEIFIIVAIIAILVIVGIITYKHLNKEVDGIKGIPVIQSPNGIFIKYEGTQKGAAIKVLIQEACIYNREEENITLGRKIKVMYDDIDLATSVNTIENIKSKEYYMVKITGYDESGYVNEITITQEQGE